MLILQEAKLVLALVVERRLHVSGFKNLLLSMRAIDSAHIVERAEKVGLTLTHALRLLLLKILWLKVFRGEILQVKHRHAGPALELGLVGADDTLRDLSAAFVLASSLHDRLVVFLRIFPH